VLDTSLAKIERAKEQISNLKSEIDAFFESGAYAVIEECDLQTRERVYRLRIYRPPLLKLHLANISEKHVLPVLVGVAYSYRAYDPTAAMRASGADVKPMRWIITGKKGGQLKFPLEDGDEGLPNPSANTG
jgi:hypothetical protein